MKRDKTFPILIILFLLTTFSGAVHAQQPWTLEECIEHAWENNLRLQQQRLTVDLARENLNQSRANQLPNLNGSASHVYSFGRTIDPFTNDFATERVQSNNFSLSSGMNLFSGFQVQNTIKQNRLELEASHLDLEKSYNDVALMVASAYLQVLFSSELVDIAVNQIEISKQQVDRTGKLVEAGALPQGALLTIQAQLATEELQLVNAQNQLDLAYLNLSQILFLAPDQPFSIAFPAADIEPDQEPDQSPMQVFQTAVLQQPEVRSSEIRIGSAERGLSIARGARSPMLRLSGSYGTGYSEASLGMFRTKPFADQLKDNLNRSLGLFLSIPVFNNSQARTNISRSKINLENAQLQNQIVREQLFQTIQQAHADAGAALKRYQATEKNLTALEESFRYTEQRFNVGMVNSVEYNDGKNRLAAAQSELLQSKYEYIFRMKILDFYQGKPLSL